MPEGDSVDSGMRKRMAKGDLRKVEPDPQVASDAE
jgi:hypothetical protein